MYTYYWTSRNRHASFPGYFAKKFSKAEPCCAHQATMYRNPFSDGEIDGRQATVRKILGERGLAGAVFAAPESVFWLTGLDHWGYFAPHLLILPVDGRAVLVTRAMERVTIENQVRSAD